MTLIDPFVTDREVPAGAGLPRGPRLPRAVQTVLFLTRRNQTSPRWHRRFGDVFSIHIAPAGHGVVLADPDHIREVFAGPADTFHAGEGNAILGPIMGQHSVLLLDEEEHRLARKKVMAAFHGEAMRAWGQMLEELAADNVARWPVGRPFAVHPHMNNISLEVILRIVFGVTDPGRIDRMRPLLQRLVRIGPMIFIGWMYPQLQRLGPWRRFAELKASVDRMTRIALEAVTADGH